MSPHVTCRRRPIVAPRRGFSLVELMVVIVVISILMALILPAIGGASKQAQVTKTQVEIKGLETNMVAFKGEFGMMPPSSITLYEAGTGNPSWASDSADPAGLLRSKTLIRRMWPQFNYAMSRDINGDGDKADKIVLTGSECLVFFLGGMMATTDANGNALVASNADASGSPPSTPGTPAKWTPLGFSKNRRNPFARDSGTRIGPFQEFDGSRLVNVFNHPANTTDQNMPEFLDALPSQSNPYLYASSYDGRGYLPTDLVPSGMTNVYLQQDNAPATPGDPTEIPWNQNGVQIISPGFDTFYGIGGVYQSDGTPFTGNRNDERDNITNFGSGELN